MGGLRAYIAADADVAALTGTRVFAGEMPQQEADLQPRAAVVVSNAGGPPKNDWTQLLRWSIDVRAYSTTPYHARKLYLAVHNALELLHRRVIAPGPVLLHSASVSSGPLELRDPDTKWPFVYATYELLAATVVAA